ncbi:hypothetical protein Godav_002682 [Gossypium davidsonii]|uniref:Uncharacterized protein n=1 Tax=Gossypium davidsonii TaxID=34287 RepID=A0A7J8SWY3_GOSDV|nr:hypothetical protein [Gossypium davidsonii]
MELETDDESDLTNDLEARKEHDINWTLCHDTRTSCRDIEQNSSQEFYLSLKEREAIRSFYELQTFVKVRRVNILLCKRAEVPMERLDKEMNPPKKLLGVDVYKYVILQRKQKEERRKRGLQEEDE